MNKDLVLEMAPTGTLRVALNMINFLLISGKNPEGVPLGTFIPVIVPPVAEKVLDVDRALWMLAFNNVLVNLDSYSGAFRQNYYLYHD